MTGPSDVLHTAEALPLVVQIEDDEVTNIVTQLQLQRLGFRVVSFHRGAEALPQLSALRPDIVLLDALMPEMDGFEVCRRIRAMPEFAHLPVLMLTGLDDEASVDRAYREGVTDFFLKDTGQLWNLLAARIRYMLRHHRQQMELERTQARLARAQDFARMGSADWQIVPGRQHPSLLELSPEARRVLSLAPDEPVSLRSLLRMVKPAARRELLHLFAAGAGAGSTLSCDVPLLIDGRRRVIQVDFEPEYNEAGGSRAYSGVLQDVTERRNQVDKIRRLANFDVLTGLPNRGQLIARADQALEDARRHGHSMALLLLDLDRFKVINDTLGHGAGDELLIEASRRMRSCVGHYDEDYDLTSLAGLGSVARGRMPRRMDSIGRWGGDEFVALLPRITSDREAQEVADAILGAMREPVYLAGGRECFVTASIGVAVYPRDGLSVNDLLRKADIAMYSAKDSGKNNALMFTPTLAGRGVEKLDLEAALHRALERQELELEYQPKVDAVTNRLMGLEALLRWRRNGRLVMPGEFLPAAEEAGLMVPFTEWVLREASRQVGVWWREMALDTSVAVNVPARMFDRTDFVQLMHNCVIDNGIPHRALRLEITEDGLMKGLGHQDDGLQRVTATLHQLNEIGIEISVDDFGTGYSSLAYLTSLPIAELKIDRRFVRDIGVTHRANAVVTAILALARSLGLRVVAEGVETLVQLESLARMGCHGMQGWLFSRSLPAAEVPAWIERNLSGPGLWARVSPDVLDPDDTDLHAGLTVARALR